VTEATELTIQRVHLCESSVLSILPADQGRSGTPAECYPARQYSRTSGNARVGNTPEEKPDAKFGAHTAMISTNTAKHDEAATRL